MSKTAENKMEVYTKIMHEVINDTMQDLIVTLREKCKDTFLHGRRVADLCILVGFEMKLSVQEIEDLALAAFLHDVGKIAVPDRILKKPGALTDDEMAVMRTHARAGAGVLRVAGGSSESIKALACHHEHYNGKGYPYRLRGENIPFLSRIISVADAFDSMTSKRCYAGDLKRKEAIQRLTACSGTQFDPDITDVFVDRINAPKVYMLDAV